MNDEKDKKEECYITLDKITKCSFCGEDIHLNKDNFLIIVEKRKIDKIEIDKVPKMRFVVHDYCMHNVFENALSIIEFAINKGNDVY